MCKFGNKNVFLTLAFSIFQFSVFLENGNFQFFFKIVSATFLVSSHTLSNSFILCKFKKVGLKFVSQNVT